MFAIRSIENVYLFRKPFANKWKIEWIQNMTTWMHSKASVFFSKNDFAMEHFYSIKFMYFYLNALNCTKKTINNVEGVSHSLFPYKAYNSFKLCYKKKGYN